MECCERLGGDEMRTVEVAKSHRWRAGEERESLDGRVGWRFFVLFFVLF